MIYRVPKRLLVVSAVGWLAVLTVAVVVVSWVLDQFGVLR